MNISVCIGSSCHLKGSRQVVEKLQALIEEKGVAEKVELAATFCLGKCQQGVCVMADEEFFSVSPDTVDEFFNQNVLAKI